MGKAKRLRKERMVRKDVKRFRRTFGVTSYLSNGEFKRLTGYNYAEHAARDRAILVMRQLRILWREIFGVACPHIVEHGTMGETSPISGVTMSDIHAITEVFDVVDTALSDVHAALADGKVDWTDAQKFVNLWNPVKKALADATLVVGEATSLDGGDVTVILNRVIQVVTEAINAVTPPQAKAADAQPA